MTNDREARLALADVLMRLVYTYIPRDDYEKESLRLARDALGRYGNTSLANEVLQEGEF